jgi:hypothetical protein
MNDSTCIGYRSTTLHSLTTSLKRWLARIVTLAINGSALECASIHDVLRVCDAITDDANQIGKSNLKRIVSMLTRLIQRTTGVSEDRIEYEYEYRDAEYEYDEERNEYNNGGVNGVAAIGVLVNSTNPATSVQRLVPSSLSIPVR